MNKLEIFAEGARNELEQPKQQANQRHEEVVSWTQHVDAHFNNKTFHIHEALQEEGKRERRHLEQWQQALKSKVADQGDYLQGEMKEIKEQLLALFWIQKDNAKAYAPVMQLLHKSQEVDKRDWERQLKEARLKTSFQEKESNLIGKLAKFPRDNHQTEPLHIEVAFTW